METSLKATAYHEAGHAVAQIALGFNLDQCTIVPEGDCLGHVEHPDPIWGYETSTRRERNTYARSAIIACYAGLAAEHHFCGTPFSFEEGAKHGAWYDHDQAWDLLRKYGHVRGAEFVGDDKYDAALGRLQRGAVRFIRQHQDTIERVAQRLLAQHMLTEEEVRAAIDGR